MKTDRIFGQPSTFRIIGKCLTVTDFGGVVQKARKNTASPAIVGGIGQADCLDGAELSAPSSGWNKRPSGISGDQLTKVKNKAPPEISDGQGFSTSRSRSGSETTRSAKGGLGCGLLRRNASATRWPPRSRSWTVPKRHGPATSSITPSTRWHAVAGLASLSGTGSRVGGN